MLFRRLEQAPKSASWVSSHMFQSSSQHCPPTYNFQSTIEHTLSSKSINLKNLPSTFEVEKLRHRKVKKLTHIFTDQENIGKRKKNKPSGSGEMA